MYRHSEEPSLLELQQQQQQQLLLLLPPQELLQHKALRAAAVRFCLLLPP